MTDPAFEKADKTAKETAEMLRAEMAEACMLHNAYVEAAKKGSVAQIVKDKIASSFGTSADPQSEDQTHLYYHVMPVRSRAATKYSTFSHFVEVIATRPDRAEPVEIMTVGIRPRHEGDPALMENVEPDYLSTQVHIRNAHGGISSFLNPKGFSSQSDTPLTVKFGAEHMAYSISRDLQTRIHDERLSSFTGVMRANFVHKHDGVPYNPGIDQS